MSAQEREIGKDARSGLEQAATAGRLRWPLWSILAIGAMSGWLVLLSGEERGGAPVGDRHKLFAALKAAWQVGAENQDDLRAVDEFERVTIGAPREAVLARLGRPWMAMTIAGDAFYYLAARDTPETAPPRQVLSVYFRDGRVTRLARYTLRGDQVFDEIGGATLTNGDEYVFLRFIALDPEMRR